MNPRNTADTHCHPLIILGSGRCGTTLLQRVLNQCDDVAISGEHAGMLLGIAEAFFTARDRITKNHLCESDIVKNALAELKDGSKWSAWTNWLHTDTLVKQFREMTLALLAPEAVRTTHHWGFKEVRYGSGDRVIEFLLELFPNAKIIVLVRDPVDTIASMRSYDWRNGASVVDLARDWALRYSNYLVFAKEHSDNLRFVHYEDLGSANLSPVYQLLEWAGVEIKDNYADRFKQVLDDPAGRYASPSRKENIQPREGFTIKALSAIHQLTHNVQKELGYGSRGKLRLSPQWRLRKDLSEKSGAPGLIKESGEKRSLNATGELILMLCDGSYTQDELVQELLNAYEPEAEQREELIASVVVFIAHGIETGVLLRDWE